jgi:hypothetical protein
MFVYEPVLYAPGALNANGPVTGFAVPWIAEPGVSVLPPPGLMSPIALPSAPGSGAVGGCCNSVDPLVNTIPFVTGKEFWASFLLFHSGPNDQTFMGLSPPGAPLGSLPSAAFGVRLGQYGIFVGSTFTPAPVPFTPIGSTDFLVAHFTAGGAAWIMGLYVNPPPGSLSGPPTMVLNVPPVSYGTMVNQNQAQFESDEFRLGDTPGDVAPGVTGVALSGDPSGGMSGPSLRRIAPNPLVSETTIQYEVSNNARTRLVILDVRGRVVSVLRDEATGEGFRSVRWNGTDDSGRRVPPGVYFVRLTSGGVARTGRVLVIR